MEMEDRIVLAAASTYDKKYYLNPDFDSLPDAVKQELRIICVRHTAEVGGIITVSFTEEGELMVESQADEEDILFDEIGAHLMIKKVLKAHSALWESLEMFFRVFYLGEDLTNI